MLIFAESRNDSESLRELLVAANPRLECRVRPRPRPTSLTREASLPAIRGWADALRRSVKAHTVAQGPVAAVLVHRDADGPDPDGRVAEELGRQLSDISGHPVVPVQAIEAWWFLFPDAVEAVRPLAWRDCQPRKDRDVERIDTPKDVLQRLTRSKRGPSYAEADSLAIARAIRVSSPQRYGHSVSYDAFVALGRSLR